MHTPFMSMTFLFKFLLPKALVCLWNMGIWIFLCTTHNFFFLSFFILNFLAPHLGHIYLTIYCTFITLCADNMVELQLLLIHLICSGCQASPSLLICCICWQWPGPLLLLHHYLRLLPSFSVPAYNCCIRWWSCCPNLQLLVCCCLAAYSCTGAATLLLM